MYKRQLSSKEVGERSQQICQRFFDAIDLEKVSCVHCYLPMVNNNEINTLLLIEEFHKRGIEVVVPVADFETHEMQIAQYTKSTPLLLKKGIPEPSEPHFVEIDQIDLVVLPLAIFDVTGFRVGYGGGFYDRFLQKINDDVQLVGLSFFDPVDDIDPNEYDVAMNACLTTKGTYLFD